MPVLLSMFMQAKNQAGMSEVFFVGNTAMPDMGCILVFLCHLVTLSLWASLLNLISITYKVKKHRIGIRVKCYKISRAWNTLNAFHKYQFYSFLPVLTLTTSLGGGNDDTKKKGFVKFARLQEWEIEKWEVDRMIEILFHQEFSLVHYLNSCPSLL